MPTLSLIRCLAAGLSIVSLAAAALLSLTLNEATAKADTVNDSLYAALSEVRQEKEPVVLVKVGNVDTVQAHLEQQGIDPDIIKRENNEAYYATKFVHRLRRYGKLWIVFDHSEEGLDGVLHDRFFDDYQVEVDRDFGHLTLISVINEFATDAAPDNLVTLEPVTRVNHVVTDLVMLPDDQSMLVTTKRGDVFAINLGSEQNAEPQLLLNLAEALQDQGEIHQVGEAGLIGLALHPAFPGTFKLYLHYNLDQAGGERMARIAEWTAVVDDAGVASIDPTSERVLLDIPQPASNHNGGDLVFGGDGFLYIAVGDGEDGEWVKGRAKAGSLRGKVLRIDVDKAGEDHAYAIPADNPFVGDPDFPPETYAWGFRNPWRLAFAPDGRLIAGDVGEDVHEEITAVQRGRHHGWPAMEGSWCRLENACDPEISVGPLFQYGRDAGMSVTGGEVYEGDQIDWLKGAYVFADFSSGWIWSIDLPEGNSLIPPEEATELGRWAVEFTTFTKARDGEIYLGDLRGHIYRLAPGPADAQQSVIVETERKS